MTMAIFEPRRMESSPNSHRAGTAFVVESLLMLVFLLASLAVLLQLFFGSAARGTDGKTLQQAVVVAQNEAERFSADPTGVDRSLQENGFLVTCDVTSESTGAGVLYHASISVSKDGSEVYGLATARYESGV